jgi:glutathione peroxidase
MYRKTLHTILHLSLLFTLPTTGWSEPASLLHTEASRLNGETESLASYDGQVLLIVNTASRCGYTSQYSGLQKLYERYRKRGFSVLGFPSNDFAGQEPGSDTQIASFCRLNYGVEFPMFSKIRVKGSDAHPVYAYIKALPEPIGGEVSWNFQKFLVDRSGRVVARFAPRMEPQDPRLITEIERLLEEEPVAPPSARTDSSSRYVHADAQPTPGS